MQEPIRVFSKEWFEQHQSKILKLANTRYGRWLLRIHGDRSSVGNSKITKILPNVIFWSEGDQNKAEFRTPDKFAKRLYYGLKPLWFMLDGWDFIFGDMARQLDFGFNTLTQFPGSIGTDNPLDGNIDLSGQDATLATIRGVGTGTTAVITDNEATIARLVGSTTTNQYQALKRSIYCFDTSSMGAGATVSAATFSLWSRGVKQNGLGSPDLHIAGATPASTTALATSDFSNIARTSYGSVTYANFDVSDTAYTDITLNSSGQSNIVANGISSFSAH